MSDHLPREPYARVTEVMSGFALPWALCGGWAIDAWLGRRTRDHGDVDVFVLEEHDRALFEHLSPGWALIAHDGAEPTATTAWNGRRLVHPAHVHAMPTMEMMLAEWVPNGSDGPMPLDDPSRFRLDIMFNEEREGRLVLLAKPVASAGAGEGRAPETGPRAGVSLPAAEAIRRNALGLPALVPEALIFLKATAYWAQPAYQEKRPYDEEDARALLPLVGPGQRPWLRESVESCFPGHPWLEWPDWGR